MRNEFIGIILVASLLPGLLCCASTGDSSAAHVASNGATLVNYGSLLRPRCENADMQVINGQHEAVCRAYLESLDNKAASQFANETRLEPGRHSLTVGCSYAVIGPNDHGAVPQMKTSISYEGTFDAATKYYIRAEMGSDNCRVWVSETPPPPPAPLWKAFLP